MKSNEMVYLHWLTSNGSAAHGQLSGDRVMEHLQVIVGRPIEKRFAPMMMETARAHISSGRYDHAGRAPRRHAHWYAAAYFQMIRASHDAAASLIAERWRDWSFTALFRGEEETQIIQSITFKQHIKSVVSCGPNDHEQNK